MQQPNEDIDGSCTWCCLILCECVSGVVVWCLETATQGGLHMPLAKRHFQVLINNSQTSLARTQCHSPSAQIQIILAHVFTGIVGLQL